MCPAKADDDWLLNRPFYETTAMAVIIVGVGLVRFFFIATVSVSPIRQTVSPESERPVSVARGRPLCKKVKSTPDKRLRENESARANEQAVKSQ